MYEKAAEVMVDACAAFIREYGELSDDFFEQLMRLLGRVPISIKGPDVAVLYLKEIAGALSAAGDSKRSEQLLVAAYNRETAAFRRRRQFVPYMLYGVWRATSSYGTSLGRWGIWTIVLSFLFFPLLLWSAQGLIGHHSWLEYVYVGFLGFTPSGPPEVPLSAVGKVVVAFEVAVGYVFTAVLATLLLRKVSR
jgi:hypothetical protein